MREKREKLFHSLGLVDFIAVRAFEDVILAIVNVVVVFGDDLVGVENSLIAETTEYGVVETLERKI